MGSRRLDLCGGRLVTGLLDLSIAFRQPSAVLILGSNQLSLRALHGRLSVHAHLVDLGCGFLTDTRHLGHRVLEELVSFLTIPLGGTSTPLGFASGTLRGGGASIGLGDLCQGVTVCVFDLRASRLYVAGLPYAGQYVVEILPQLRDLFRQLIELLLKAGAC
ncbi:hypothetical protein EB73_21160 [Mycobacterium sp. SWH-M3]|nr:hypothetical protein EB73_21160 [Mycobacterium sp. SWH-M3]